ncbi:MAG: nucleoside hydrolase [Candidatus Hydrogenedens sp.]|nr:nucleoside hydrolase [Candidatus Hydrogenedens sp.]
MICLGIMLALLTAPATPAAEFLSAMPDKPVKMIFDTDIGNDVDDALALGVIHALQSRGECELLAVTITKDHEESVPCVDAINHFYGRGGIPIGIVKGGVTPQQSKFTAVARKKEGDALKYPHDQLTGDDAPDATEVLRKTLAAQDDGSVVIVQVGFSTNLARLLDSEGDEFSPLNGKELAAQKVKCISIMAGAFEDIPGSPDHREYNVVMDVPPAQKLVEEWPTPIIFSGYEIGLAITFPAVTIDHDFAYAEKHPLPEAYQMYEPTPHERPCWDLTSVLWAVRPDRGYYDLSPAGKVTVTEEGWTPFEAQPEGKHFYLIADAVQHARSREALALLATQPPDGKK